MKFIRIIAGSNILLLFVLVLLPVLLIKPDLEIMQTLVEYINKE